ncbi:N-hydroxyarylamine O-acetyltransferase [Sphingomonas laterariae]|uniref:N-hydroxyarylamine O-acetyltransferase n=2 Tax=Edaphosphingomonas laterariae TaxID=861865 RepID=A0A239L0P1_9SPHN|nr:N-hydroxyarylamine O-acetyltransferase [Sphingomonas laterariae]
MSALMPRTLTPAEQHAYCARIGLTRLPQPDAAGLLVVQRAHRLAIPFENLDIILGRGISLDPDHVFAKLVGARRGGYCFEQNQLFLRVLQTMGFVARPLLGRVWLMANGVTPGLTHTFNLVELDGAQWIADAGFGGFFTPPMRVADGGEAVAADGGRYRLVARDPAIEPGWMLQRAVGDNGWADQYSFTQAPAFPADLALSNHWTATSLPSRFTSNRIASLVTPDGLLTLNGRGLTERAGDTVVLELEIGSASAYRALLVERFGIVFDAATVDALGLF